MANTVAIQAQVVINGIVKRIISTQTNGWQAVELKVYKEKLPDFLWENKYYNTEKFNAVGYFKHNVEIDQTVTLTGEWIKHKSYGWQFKVSDSDILKPQTIDEIEAYLCSGIFKGIGPKTAKTIVEAFGEKAIEIVEKNPEALAKIKGIKRSKIASITTSQEQNGHLKEIKLFLGNREGVTIKRIMKIYDRYKDKAVEVLSQNPYVLCEDIDGFGFKTADAIAMAVGVPFDSKFRIRAGIIYTLDEAAKQSGHMYLTSKSLLTNLTKLLSANNQLDSKITKPVLKEMIQAEELIQEDDKIFLKYFYTKEIDCAEKLFELYNASHSLISSEAICNKLNEIENICNIKYSEKQTEAIISAMQQNITVITGGPGTGKTTIIKGIITLHKRLFPDEYICLCAPTGRAAKRMEETTGFKTLTIHRLLEAKPGLGFARNKDYPLNCGCIIVDEMSMVDLYTFYALINAIKKGTRVILVGDKDQLPSVGPGAVLKDLIQSGAFNTVELNQIFRQQNTSKIIVNAHKINKGNISLDFGEDFEFINEPNPENVPTLLIQKYLEEAKTNGGIENVQILSPLRTRTSAGVNTLNERVQNTINPYSVLKHEMKTGLRVFREGDKVMQMANDYDREIFNGTIGKITSIEKILDQYSLYVDAEDSLVEYDQDDLETLDLAYAITIHKSQGSEYPVVVMPILENFYPFLSRDILYTAVTRARKKVIIIGTAKALIMAIKNNKTKNRNTTLAQRITEVFNKGTQ